MWRCKHCGEEATAAGCPYCDSTAVEHIQPAAGDVLDTIDVRTLIDVTALGDTVYHYYDPGTGKIVTGGPIQWTIGGEVGIIEG